MNAETLTRATDQTRERLLQSAFCEIHRNGFQGASVADILDSTGLTKGALYHHFPTKHALGLAVIDEVIAGTIDRLVLEPIRSSANPVQALLEVLLHLPDVLEADRLLLGCPLNNLMQEMSPLDETFRAHLNRILAEWRTVLRQAFEAGQQQGTVRADVDAEAAALFVLSAWEGCTGVAKSMQSTAAFKVCVGQLRHYVIGLMPDAHRA